MSPTLPGRLLAVTVVAVSLQSRADLAPADSDCTPAEHPPDPDSAYDHTKLAHLADMIGSYGFDLPGAVYSLAISPDNSRILAGGASRTALLWHPKAGRALRETDVTDRDVTAVGFSPDSKVGLVGLGLSGTEGYPIYSWDLITGSRIKAFGGHAWDVTSVSFSHDGQLILSSSRDGTVKLWDPQTGKELRSMQHPWQAMTAVFSPDDKLILSATRDGGLFLWSTDQGEKIRTFEGLSGPIRNIAFSHDGQRVRAISDTGILREWETQTGRSTRLLGVSLTTANGVPARFGPVPASLDQSKLPLLAAHLALSRNGEHLAVALADGTLVAWNAATMKVEDPVQAPTRTEWGGGHLVISDDGRMAVEGFINGRVRLRDLEQHQEVLTGRHVDGGLEKLVTSADGQRFFALKGNPHQLMLLDAELNPVKVYDTAGEGRFEPSGRLALVTFTDEKTGRSTLKIVNATSGEPVRQLIDSIFVEAFGFTNDMRQVQALYTLDPPGDSVKSYLVTWEVRSGRKLKEANVPYVGETLLTLDGKSALTSTTTAGMVLWDLVTVKVKRNVGRAASGHQRPLALSPDGKLVATAGADKIISLWDVNSGDLSRVFRGHRCRVRGATFTPDSKRLVSIGGADEELRLWDGQTGQQIDGVDLISHNDHPVSATLSNDGQSFLVATSRGVVMRFDFDTAEASAGNSEEVPLPPPDDAK